MGCDEVRDLLAIVAGGEARDEDRLAVEEHASHCASCARELDLYREARANLAALREEGAPSGTWKSIWAGVRTELFPKKASRSLAYFDSALRYAAVVMAGLAIGVGLHVMTRPSSPSPFTRVGLRPEAQVTPAAVGERPGLRFAPEEAAKPRFFAPRAKPDGNSYLPRVEAVPAGGERDY